MNSKQLEKIREDFENAICETYGFSKDRIGSLRDNWGYLDQELLNIPQMWEAWKLAAYRYQIKWQPIGTAPIPEYLG